MVLTDVKQGWYLADKIKSSGAGVLLSLALPKAAKKKASDKKAKKDAKTKKDEKAKDDAKKPTPKNPEKEMLEKRRDEMLKLHESTSWNFPSKRN